MCFRHSFNSQGGFYSAEDADSKLDHDSDDHAEGAFYVWEKKEIEDVLGEDAPIFMHHFGVKGDGNTPPGTDIHGGCSFFFL